MNIMQLIEQHARKNPQALQTPRGQSLVGILQSGNEQRGIEAANNILQSMGLSKEEGIAQAKQFFGIR